MAWQKRVIMSVIKSCEFDLREAAEPRRVGSRSHMSWFQSTSSQQGMFLRPVCEAEDARMNATKVWQALKSTSIKATRSPAFHKNMSQRFSLLNFKGLLSQSHHFTNIPQNKKVCSDTQRVKNAKYTIDPDPTHMPINK